MICPECQHQQAESKIAISTYCRGCGSHYKISHGIAATDSKIPNNPFAAKSSANSKADEPIDRSASDEHNVTATSTATEADQLDGQTDGQTDGQEAKRLNAKSYSESHKSDQRSTFTA